MDNVSAFLMTVIIPVRGFTPVLPVMMLSNCHEIPCFVSWRIVKMSSPNLNIVTLLGSGLTYTSAYLFGIQEQSLPSGNSMEKLIQVSVLMKICSAAKKLTHSLPAPVLCQAVVTVWRIPSSFVFLSACCTSTSPAACLQECPLGTCLKSLPWCRCGLQNSKGRSDRKCLVAFCVCESHSPAVAFSLPLTP